MNINYGKQMKKSPIIGGELNMKNASIRGKKALLKGLNDKWHSKV